MRGLRHINIPNIEGDTFEAIELLGTGLAMYRDHNPFWKRDEYYLIHIASGSRLISDFVCSFVHACQWVRSFKDLIDWTQPESSFQQRHDVEVMVRVARLDIPVGEWQAYENIV